ncbi:hypothetical protein Rhal01_03321 [Rubritalea halochordaticola]|uniref:exo-alpha-sialidase n=1 Tax=Rubritalea halochordaticola TaxID=714537 RepID=A0ABP9V396_9BACT
MKWITLILTICLPVLLQAETLYLVKDGEITENAYKKGSSWKEEKASVTGKGPGQTLGMKLLTDGSEFTISATLVLKEVKHTAAGIIIGNDFFGFDSNRQTLFLEGSGFGGFQQLDAKVVAGKPFTLTAESKDGKITFQIDGKTVAERPYTVADLSHVALRPHRGQILVKEFLVTGTFTKPAKLNHLFACGQEGYASYRIPALVTTKSGTLLAFCEGRKDHAGDHGNIDIVLKRSTDGGKTWTPLQIVFDYGKHVAGNPCPIVEQDTGRIFLLSCTSDHHEGAIMAGKGRRGIFIQHSDDDGKTWTEPRDIASNIYPENWRWYATGPCSGIQIREGKHAKRLVAPANHSTFENGKSIYRAHSLYSDDLGKTWQFGTSAADGSNESQIAEVAPDILYHNMRMQTHSQKVRGVRTSTDGGATWTEMKHDFNLPGPRCQGSVIRDYSKPQRLIFSNPASRSARTDMTIRISDDGGKTWPYSKRIHPYSSAYSDLSITKEGKVAILFEGGYASYIEEGIIFNLYEMKDLMDTPQVEAATPAHKKHWDLWSERQAKFNERAKQGEVDILMIGDSITHYWQSNKMCKTDGQELWDKYFRDRMAANFGIGSDRTQHLLYRLQNGNLENLDPDFTVLMIGTNNATSLHTPYEIYLGTEAIIKTVQQHCPGTTILLYDIFPRLRGGSPMQNLCSQANDLTDSLCDGKKVIRCSINQQLLDEQGQPNKKIFFDGIHLSTEGYEIWAKDILRYTN